MTKVVYNNCYGGFSLSHEAMLRLAELKGIELTWEMEYDLYLYKGLSNRPKNRQDPHLVQVVEELGPAANGEYAKLAICEIPAGVRFRIDEYDGAESVMTIEDYDWEVAK